MFVRACFLRMLRKSVGTGKKKNEVWWLLGFFCLLRSRDNATLIRNEKGNYQISVVTAAM